MVAAMGGLDAVVFTGGIGENDHCRSVARSCAVLRFWGVVMDEPANRQNAERELHDASSRVAIWIVSADEERQIAIEAAAVMAGESA